MKLLSLDQSSHITGWAIFEDGKLVTYGKFALANEDLGERLYHYRNEVMKLIKEHKINQVAFEDIQLQESAFNNVVTYKILAEIFGITEELLYELKIPYQVISSNTWKSKLKIKGKKRTEQKQNAQQWVLNTYNVKAIQDICDAICLGASLYIEDKKVEHFSWE